MYGDIYIYTAFLVAYSHTCKEKKLALSRSEKKPLRVSANKSQVKKC